MSEITRLIAEANDRLNTPKVEHVEEPEPEIINYTQQMIDVAKAVVGLGEEIKASAGSQAGALDELTTSQVIEIQSGFRALIRTLDTISKDQAKQAEGATKAHKAMMEGVVSELAKAKPENTAVIEQKPVKFDIERDRNGYMQSVTATPVGA